MKKKIIYVEPIDYFPEEIRKEFKLGEYAEKEDNEIPKKKAIDIEFDYISRETRKKFKLGEFAEENVEVKMKVTVETKDGILKADDVEEVEKLLETLDK